MDSPPREKVSSLRQDSRWRVSLGSGSPTDRPVPTEYKQTPWWGGTAPGKRAQAPPPGDLKAAWPSPSDRRNPTRLDGGVVRLGEEKMKHFCVDRRIKHSCVDLKVCEGCGGLWLRAQNGNQNHGVYCRNCSLRLSEFPPPRGRSRAGRKPKLRLVVCEGGTK